MVSFSKFKKKGVGGSNPGSASRARNLQLHFMAAKCKGIPKRWELYFWMGQMIMYLHTTSLVVSVCMTMKCSLGGFDNPRGTGACVADEAFALFNVAFSGAKKRIQNGAVEIKDLGNWVVVPPTVKLTTNQIKPPKEKRRGGNPEFHVLALTKEQPCFYSLSFVFFPPFLEFFHPF